MASHGGRALGKTLDGVQAVNGRSPQLFVTISARYRPRLPKQGYYHIAEQLGQGGFGFGGGRRDRADWANLGDVGGSVVSRLGGVTHADRLVVPAQHRVVFTGQSWKVAKKCLPRGIATW